MLSGILIFNQKGENLIFRAFRNDCRPRLADVFRIQVISNAQVRSPILTLGSTTFSHVKHENIYLVAVTKSNANAALVFEFLYRLVALGKAYFGKFDEEAVKNNFVLVYELLDGMCNMQGLRMGGPGMYERRLIGVCRDSRFRIPAEYGDGYVEDVYHNGGCQVRKSNGRQYRSKARDNC
jgi:AP-2 complex subunit mu-1